jgi:uncharacterized membrane protein YccF (DUF307 family)
MKGKDVPMNEQSTSPRSVIVEEMRDEPGCLVQILWFLFVGSWLGALVVSVAWFLNATIIGLPIGMALLNNIPQVIALQNPQRRLKVIQEGDFTKVIESDLPQRNFFVRAIYFLVIGWWWSGLWMAAAYALCATIILMPFGLAMFRLTPFMTTLQRY